MNVEGYYDTLQAPVAHMVAEGFLRPEASLVVEVSAVVDSNDVRRAARRAGLLSSVTRLRAVAAVAGKDVPEAARTEARNAGVWCVLDGLTSPPAAPS